MRVLLTGGGTGGHVNPALAIADIIKGHVPDAQIAFVGTSHGIENKLVTRAGYKLYHVEISGIRRSLSPSNIKTAYRVITSPAKAKKVIREFRPDVVIGTGGYACWPALYAASRMGIPTMLHEANAIPGVAVKMLCTKVDVILTNFESTASLIKTDKKIVNVGMPMREAFGTLTREAAREKLSIDKKYKTVILSFGGSLGAPMVNNGVIDVMTEISSVRDDVYHIHASGSREYERMLDDLRSRGLDKCKNIEHVEYIYDMPTIMSAADIVICRSGAMTLTELSRLGRASVLIPSPNVTAEHQLKNAKVLQKAGAALIVEEKDFGEGALVHAVSELVDSRKKREDLEKNAARLYDRETGNKIFSELCALIEQKKKQDN